mgnify:FL=1
MCKNCLNVLGYDTGRMTNGLCDKCSSPTAISARDDYEALMVKDYRGMPKYREEMVQRHRKKNHEKTKNTRVIKTWKDL